MSFDMNAAWQEATSMVRANREVLAIIAGIFFFLPSLASGLALPDMSTLFANPDSAEAQIMAFYSNWGWMIALIVLLQIVGYLAMLALLRDRSRPTVAQAFGIGAKSLLPAIGTYLVFVIAVALVATLIALPVAFLGSVGGAGLASVLIVAAVLVISIYASVRLSLCPPVIAIDKVRNPIKVLRRSWGLTKGHASRLFLFYLLLMVVYFVISILLSLLVGTFAMLGSIGNLVAIIIMGLIGAVVSVIFVAVLAAIHRQLSSPWASNADESEFAG